MVDKVFWSCSSCQWIKGEGGGSPAPDIRPPGEFPHPESPGQTGCLVSWVKSGNSIISSKVYQRLCNPPPVIVKKREADQLKKSLQLFENSGCCSWTTQLEKRSIIIILQDCLTFEKPFQLTPDRPGLVKEPQHESGNLRTDKDCRKNINEFLLKMSGSFFSCNI